MNTLTEFDIEKFAISLLETLGYEYIYAPNIAPDSKTPERESFEQVLLLGRLQKAVNRINSSIPADVQAEAIKEIQRISSPELLANNETFHRLLTEGIPVSKRVDGAERGDRVWLIDFKNPYNNEFVVSNQFTVVENNHDKRPDIVLFVNGIPLVVMELKNPADENATIRSAFNQVETYKSVIPSLFTYNGVVVISDGLEAKAGSISAGFSRYMAWKTSDGKTEASHLVSELETLILGMLNKETLLDLIRHFIVFEKQKREDPETKITTITTVKKLAAYHQYYAVNRAVESTLRASYSPSLEGCQTQSDGVGLLTPEKWQTESDGMGLSHPEGLDGVVEDPGLYRNSQNYFSLPYNPKLKERARALRQAGNLSEVVFWNRVKNKQFKGYDFDRQKIIGNYIVDFYCTNCNVVIEIDGSSHDDKVEYDANRDAYLESLGLTVIHIPVADVMRSLDAVMEMLYEHPALQRSTHPVQQSWTPLQRRGIESSDLRTPLQRTGIESSDLRTPLQRTGIESSDLRTPLQGTGIESSDLRTPLQGTGIESSDLRTPLQETGIESSDLRTPLQGTGIESSDLRTPLQGTGIESSDLRTPLQGTGIESSDLRTPLQGTGIESSDLRTPLQGTGIESSDLRTPFQRRGIAEESPESYGLPGVKRQPVGDRKGGVIWHTQGSGKSLSMVFYTGKIVLAMNNPTVVVITDRNDLDDQLFDTFAASKQLLRQDPVQAENRNHLKELLKVGSGGVVFTTIQKFQPEEGNVYELLSDRENIVVIADEAHRTQYGFKAKTIDDKDEQGDVIGKKIVYGFAKYMRDALPNATYLGFTGTPIENSDINTPAVFGNYVDIYDIAQAVEDGATVPIYYESRLAKVNLSEEGRKLVDEFDDELDQEDLTDTQKAKAKWTQLEALVGSENRINQIAKDIIEHFELRQTAFEGKAMIVAMSRRIAAELYEAIIKLRPEWHSDELTQGVIKVVMTSASSDGPKIAKHHTTKEQRRILADRMKNPDDELKLVIVRDMWLTGFDVPCMHTLYIDKPMKGHNLMQAIARVNRVYKDKPGGLIVDYLGIAADLKQALSFYSDAGGKGDPTILQEEAVQMMLEKLEVVSQMFKESPASERGGFNYKDYFSADTSKKLSIILAAEEHILGLEDGKKRYINEVTALSKAFAIAVPHDKAMDVKDEISFFQAVKARLAKFDSIRFRKKQMRSSKPPSVR
jgi:type I site-specific restriction-modification system R (restriction) subunit/very-short-patch-repair endonuclease